MRHSPFSARYGMFPQRRRLLAMHHSSISLLHKRFSARYGSILSAAGCSLCTIEYLLMLVAKLQLNSDIPTNSDKIFIVFPVFYSYPSIPAVLTSTRFMTISAKIMMTSTKFMMAFVRIMMTSTKIMMTSIKIMMAFVKIMTTFVKIMTTSTINITTSAFLPSLSATPQALFAPKEHLPTPVLVKGVTAEVLIFSAETLVI